MPKVTLQLPGETEVTVLDCDLKDDYFSITLNGTVYQGNLMLTGPGEGWLSYEGRILPFYMSKKQNALNIWINGKTYTVNLFTPESRRTHFNGAAAITNGEIKAPMPGTILKVPVKPGDRVEMNQPLIIMESMKMEMTLSAPQAGIVQTVTCQEGLLVEMGTVLITLEALAPENSIQ
jgi:biotin carboxyl carrier protein